VSDLFQFPVDAAHPFARSVNPIIASSQRLSAAANYNEILDGYPSDQLAGKMTPGCSNLPYNKTTECQSLILQYYETISEAGAQQGQLPANIEQILNDNAGPLALADGTNSWNGSYEYWGVVKGVPAGMPIVQGLQVGTATVVSVFVI
jgi:hypothetical protein